MSNLRSISEGSFVLGDTNGLTFEAGSGIKISEPSEGTVRIANDETVLWSGNYTPGTGAGPTSWTVTLSDGISNYEMIKVECEGILGGIILLKGNTTGGYQFYKAVPEGASNQNIIGLMISKPINDDTHLYFECGYSTSYATAYRSNQDWGYYTLRKIVGVNRISGGN